MTVSRSLRSFHVPSYRSVVLPERKFIHLQAGLRNLFVFLVDGREGNQGVTDTRIRAGNLEEGTAPDLALHQAGEVFGCATLEVCEGAMLAAGFEDTCARVDFDAEFLVAVRIIFVSWTRSSARGALPALWSRLVASYVSCWD